MIMIFFFIGGGQAFEQSIIKEDLNEGKKARKSLKPSKHTRFFFAVCGGLSIAR